MVFDTSPALRGSDIIAAADATADLLRANLGRDWSVAVPGLEYTVASVVAHAAQGPLWYALDLWGGPTDNAAFDLRVHSDAPNERLLVSLLSAARACAASVDAAPSETRGFHPEGAADPEGFAAMACDELMIHGHDAARGLGVPYAPDSELAGRVLARLFPWHTAGPDPWRTLLWANGRIELDGRSTQQGWRWHCAPLAGREGNRKGATRDE
jgi:uncharacterized protein (TIGR03083 family)